MLYKGHLHGDFVIKGENDILFHYGYYNGEDYSQSINEVSINKDSNPSIEYPDLTKMELIVGKPILIVPIKYVSITGIRNNNGTLLPDGLSIDMKSGIISGKCNNVYSKRIYQIKAENGERDSGIVSLSFTINEKCSKGELYTLSLHSGNSKGEIMRFKVQDTLNAIYDYTGFPNNYDYEWGFCYDEEILIIYYGGSSIWDDESEIILTNIDKNDKRVYKYDVVADGGMKSDVISSYKTAIDSTTVWQKSTVYEENWLYTMKKTENWSEVDLSDTVTATGTVYYRTSFINISPSTVQYLLGSVYGMHGFAFYLNGNFIYQFNLPVNFTHDSPFEYENTASKFYIPAFLTTANNVNIFGIEFHKGPAPLAVEFTLQPFSNSETCINQDLRQYTLNELVPMTKLIDGDLTTAEVFDSNGPVTVENPIEILLSAAAEAHPFLSYSLSTRKYDDANMNCNSLIPKRWKLYGSNRKSVDGESDWILLDEVDTVMETGKTYYFNSNIKTSKVFKNIKFVITETLEKSENEDSSCGYGVELGELNGRYCLLSQCKSESYPSSNIGSFYKFPCPNGDGTDSVIVKCNLDGIWGEEDYSECPKASSIEYPKNEYEFTVGLAITPILPTINGAFVSIAFEPLLPNGIKFNPTNGEISGTPLYALENGQTYTIRLVTGDDSVEPTTQITIKIVSKSCEADGSIPKSVVGTVYRDYCENNNSGYRTIKCEMKENEAQWSSWNVDYCVSKIRPTCRIEKEYTFNIKSDVNIDFGCSPSLNEVTISPSLPLGLKISNDGKISGIAETAQNAEYSVSLKTADGGFDTLSFKMIVWDVLTKCYYPFSENQIKFVLNEKIELLAPKCNTAVGSYEITGLPTGMNYGPETGIISGKPTTKASGTITTKAKNGNSDTAEALIEYDIVEVNDDVYDNQLIGLYSKSDYISDLPNTFEPFWSLFEKSQSDSGNINSFEFEEGYSPENVFNDLNLDSSNQIFQPNIERDFNYFIKWYGFIRFEQSGSYYFKIESEERVWLFINDMLNPVVSTTSNSIESNVYVSKSAIEIGELYYRIGVMYYHSKDKNFKLKISYSSDNKEYTTIKDSMLYHVAKPLQSLKYPQTHYLFRQSENSIEEIRPTSDSTIVSASISPKFTNGLSFDEMKGIISGSPSIGSVSSDLSKYVITVVSKLNSISVDLYIDVLEDKIDNYYKGVNAKYYKISNSKCDTVPSVGTSTIERIESKLSHSIDSDWYDLGSSYLSDFLVEFDGSINVETESAGNILTLESYDSVIASIDDVEVIKSLKCGDNTAKVENYKLSAGIHKIQVKYWKSSSDIFRKLILKLNGNEIEIYNFLGSYMKYNIRKSEYISGKEITKFGPLFLNSATKNQFTSFSIDPPFTYSGISGLLFNSETGEISGIPVVTTEGFNKEFVITAKDISSSVKQENFISDSIRLIINILLPPSDLKYDDINGEVGNEISVFPKSIINGNGVRYSITSETKLPNGLELNPLSGEIRGSVSSSFTGTIEVTATNDAGSTKASLSIKIEGCSMLTESNIVIRIFINSGSDISFKFGHNLIDPIFSQDGFNLKTLYEFKNCIEYGEKIFSLSGTNINGWYEIHNEDDLLKYEEMEGVSNIESRVQTDSSRVPSVAYENTEITQFNSFKFVPVIVNGIKKIEINNLPKGMNLNETNGIISGVLEEAMSENIYDMRVVNSRNVIVNKVIQFSFTGVDTGRYTIVKVSITTKSNGNDMIIRMKSSSDNKVVLEWKNLGDNTVVTKNELVSKGLYILELTSSTMSSWSEGSSVSIVMDGTTVVSNEYFEGTTVKKISLTSDASSFINSFMKWEYKSDNSQPSSDWYKSENTNWDKYSSGSFPKRTFTTSYYKTSFYYYDNSALFIYGDMKVDFDDGIIIYINGKEIYRKNIIKGEITKDTKAYYQFNEVVTYSIRIHPNLIEYGNNIIGVELHKKDDAEKENKFKMELSGTTGEADHITQITPIATRTSEMRYEYDMSLINFPTQFNDCKEDYLLQAFRNSHDNTGVNEGTSAIANCNDGLVNAKGNYFTHKLIINKAYPYKIPYIFKEYVANAFDLMYYYPFTNNNNLAPAIFDIEGSTDYNTDDKTHNEENWETIFSYNNKAINVDKGITYTFDISNIKSYEAYRMVVTDTKGDKTWVQFNELHMRLRAQRACVADDNHKDYPKTVAGDTIELLCPDSSQLGSIKISCKSDGTWDDSSVINTCFTPSNDKIYYSRDNVINFYVDFSSTVTPSSPISGLFTKDCELPSGLTFDDNNGAISGKANPIEGEEISLKCNIKVSGEYSSEVTIKVIQLYCESVGEYQRTKAGSKNIKSCGELYNGEKYRYCPLDLSPKFEDEVNTCDPFPPLLSYQQSEYYLVKNEPVNIVPISGGLIKEWLIEDESELPSGIIFSNGIFSGLATELKSLTRFKITAKNEKYENSTHISIQIINGIPKSMTVPEENTIYTNVEIIRIKPTLDDENNGFLECKSDPELPKDLIINQLTCAITGKVMNDTYIGEKSYSLTGSVKENKVTSNSFKIKILKGECVKEEEGKDAIHIDVGQELKEYRCTEEQKGYKAFECLFENPPKFSAEIDKCVYKYPSSFSYNQEKIEMTMYNSIELKPVLGGSSEGLTTPTVFRMKSDISLLPKDLHFDSVTGIINGTLNEYIETERIVTIEVENEIKRETGISFKVDYAYCPAIEGIADKTKVNDPPITVDCPYPATGQEVYKCEKENEWTIDDSGCIDPEVGTITYSPSDLTFNVGFYDISTPTIEGHTTDIKITDRLPNGLSFNQSDGSIYGTPSVALTKQNINVYTYYKTENKTTTISITVIQLYCEEEGSDWGKTETGKLSEKECPSDKSYGQNYRKCPLVRPDPKYEDEVNTCHAAYPESIQYNDKNVISVIYNKDVNENIEVKGSYVVDVTFNLGDGTKLPDELKLNATDGRIYGKLTTKLEPGIDEAKLYKICCNGDVTVCIDIKFDVGYSNCEKDDSFESTKPGETAEIDCRNGRPNKETRLCNKYGEWEKVDSSKCHYPAPVLSYEKSEIKVYVTEEIETNNVNVVGEEITKYVISPKDKLNGLVFNENNGVISGKPSIQFDETFTIYCENEGGKSNEVSIKIKSLHRKPTNIYYGENKDDKNPLIFKVKLIQEYNIKQESGGVVSSYSITDVSRLNSYGIKFDANTGRIYTSLNSDPPKVVENINPFTVTASNEDGEATVEVNIKIIIPNCPADDGYPEIEPGESYQLKCTNGVDAYETRKCTDDGKWEAKNTYDCGYEAPKRCTYTTNNDFIIDPFAVDTNVNRIEMSKPTLDTRVNKITISLASCKNDLESIGLEWDENNGVAVGIPTSQKLKIQCRTTATNDQGSIGSNTFYISVYYKAPTVMIYNPNSFIFYTNVEIVENEGREIKLDSIVTKDYELARADQSSLLSSHGISLDEKTGFIKGTPNSQTLSETVIFVKGVNDKGSATGNFTISIIFPNCPKEGEWPATEANKVEILKCVEGYTEKFRKRECLKNGTWGEIDTSDCFDKVVTSLHYNPSTMTFYVGNEILMNKPTYYGNVVEFEISDLGKLENVGIKWNKEEGILYGTPSGELAKAEYEVRAVNNGGKSEPYKLTITVDKEPARLLVVIPNTYIWSKNGNGTVTTAVPYVIGNPIDYSISSISVITSCGLKFDQWTGQIYGTPSEVLVTQSFVLTANNAEGTSPFTTVTITIKSGDLLKCEKIDDNWPESTGGEVLYNPCSLLNEERSGIISRRCLSSGVWDSIDESQCKRIDKVKPDKDYLHFPFSFIVHGLDIKNIRETEYKILQEKILNAFGAYRNDDEMSVETIIKKFKGSRLLAEDENDSEGVIFDSTIRMIDNGNDTDEAISFFKSTFTQSYVDKNILKSESSELLLGSIKTEISFDEVHRHIADDDKDDSKIDILVIIIPVASVVGVLLICVIAVLIWKAKSRTRARSTAGSADYRTHLPSVSFSESRVRGMSNASQVSMNSNGGNSGRNRGMSIANQAKHTSKKVRV